ncbi:MAG TPA: PIG-L deacetylase family protein [Longimicrobium sp.]|nr:PIG-L deacetylase family protein [Longimicrobium sp.]
MSDPQGNGSGNGAAHGRALVVAAHPDDPEFLFGAAVASLVEQGAEVAYLVCSDGANGSRDPRAPREEVAAAREREQREAAGELGVTDVVFLRLPDGRLAPDGALRSAIAREIRRFRPELVITHFPRRALDIPIEASHPDHLAVGEAALAAVFPDAANARALPELLDEGLQPHRVKEVWIPGYERSSDHFVDATPFMERKIAAIQRHASQVGGADPRESLAWVYGWMKGVGGQAGYEYAENYRRIRL